MLIQSIGPFALRGSSCAWASGLEEGSMVAHALSARSQREMRRRDQLHRIPAPVSTETAAEIRLFPLEVADENVGGDHECSGANGRTTAQDCITRKLAGALHLKLKIAYAVEVRSSEVAT